MYTDWAEIFLKIARKKFRKRVMRVCFGHVSAGTSENLYSIKIPADNNRYLSSLPKGFGHLTRVSFTFVGDINAANINRPMENYPCTIFM